MIVGGHEILWKPQPTLADWRAHPAMGGVPLLAPWANRIRWGRLLGQWQAVSDQSPEICPTLRRDANRPADARTGELHGSMENNFGTIEVSVTSRLEFWRVPDWMAQFPFSPTRWR